jgi:hypothetical protein
VFDISVKPVYASHMGGERIQKRQQSAKARKVAESEIQQVFQHWLTVIKKGNTRAVLDDKRRLAIGWAVHDYGVDTCLKAIDGITKSPWHMGRNPSNKQYNDIGLIFRDADNVEKFSELGSEQSARERFINE